MAVVVVVVPVVLLAVVVAAPSGGGAAADRGCRYGCYGWCGCCSRCGVVVGALCFSLFLFFVVSFIFANSPMCPLQPRTLV